MRWGTRSAGNLQPAGPVGLYRFPHRSASEKIDGDANGLKDTEGIRACVASDHRLRPTLDNELGRLDTRTAGRVYCGVLLRLKHHRL